MRSLSGHIQQRQEELRELARPIIAERLEVLVEQLWEDPALWEEINDRYERGSLSGNYPALVKDLSEVPEQRHMFLRIGVMHAVGPLLPSVRQPWDESPFDGSMYAYREELYGGMAYTYEDELPAFAQEWLDELTRIGYRGMITVGDEDHAHRLPTKEQADRFTETAVSRPLGVDEEAYPVTFENSRQVLWLVLEGERSLKQGYKEVRVSDRPVRTNEAILAALTVLEGKQVDARHVREALDASDIALDESLTMQSFEKRFRHLSLPTDLLEYVFLLLRYHRPDFDELPREERLDLIESTCSHINECMDATRKLTAFLEYGTPGKRQRGAARTADRDVRAAVRRDVDGWTYRRIGEELGVPLPRDFDYKGDHPTVRQMVSRGRNILERALGKGGWQEHIDAMRTEAKRWKMLTDVEQCAEDWANIPGMPYEEAYRICEEDHKQDKERMRSKSMEPEN